MNSRKVDFRALLRIANQRPMRFRIFISLIFIPLIYLIIIYFVLSLPINKGFSESDRYMFYYLALPMLGYSLLFGIYFTFIVGKQLKVYKNGEIRDAEIISFLPAPGMPLFDSKVRVLYRYKIAGDNMVEGESVTTDLSITKLKKPGELIKIFVSPNNEFITYIVPTKDALRNNWKLE